MHTFVQPGEEPDQPVTDFVIPAQGHIKRVVLPPEQTRMQGDGNEDGNVAEDGYFHFAGCMQGPKDAATAHCQVVGRYDPGESANASERYVLRIRLESLADGNTQSNTGLSL